jgi:protein O-mannosyl-transferase
MNMSKNKKSADKGVFQAGSGVSAASWSHFWPVAGAAAIILITVVVYFPFLSGGFIWDDDQYLTNNRHIKAADGLYKYWFTTEPIDFYPVSNTTLWIEWRLWGMNPTGYRTTNLVLHIVETLLIWIILRKLMIPGAFLAAVIFAVHPVNVESVVWIAQRKDMLAFLFMLMSIWGYLRSDTRARNSIRHTPCAVSQRVSEAVRPAHRVCGVLYWLSLGSFVLGMLSKGSVAMLPVFLLMIVWWLRLFNKWDIARISPFFLVAAFLTGVHVWFQTKGTGEMLRDAGFLERLLGAGGVVWFYLYKALLPINLAFVYPQWDIKVDNPLWWLPLAAVLAVTAVFWLYRNSWSRPFLFAWGFFCVALVPVMGFTDVYFLKYALVADHYQHTAIVGVIALTSALWSVWTERSRGVVRVAAIVVAVAATGILAFLSWRLSESYCDEITLYQATLEKNPDCWMAHNNLGIALVKNGRLQEAIDHYGQVLRLKPDHYMARFNLGVTLLQLGRDQEAIEQFRQVLQKNPNDNEARVNMAIALVRTGRPLEAIEHYRQTLVLTPDSIETHYNLALAYSKINRPAEAVAEAQRALELARSKGLTSLAKGIESWLDSYQERK